MDEIDNDQEFNEKLLENFIANARSKQYVALSPSSSICDDCGNIIPEKRRQLLPGVRLCVDCQLIAEKAKRR